METIYLVFGFLFFAIWSSEEINGLPLAELRGPNDLRVSGNQPHPSPAVPDRPFAQRGSRQFPVDDEEEDEEEDTTVKGPGHEGILSGLSGIFSGIVSGNANSVVESSFNFVPPVYQKEVHNFYGGIIGRTTTEPPTTTPLKAPSEGRVTNSPLNQESEFEEGDAEEEAPPPPAPWSVNPSASPTNGIRTGPRPAVAPVPQGPWPVKPSATTGIRMGPRPVGGTVPQASLPVKSLATTGIRARPRPPRVTQPPIVYRPWASSGDDEEDVKRGV